MSQLDFNPVSKERKAFLWEINPTKAQYILNYHNEDNRKFNPGQSRKLERSMNEEGFIFDGGALTFNTEGNITEFQHRLKAIIVNDITEIIPVVLGVEPESFTKGAPAKPRKPIDEIQRKDKTATKEEVTTLGEIQRRRKSDPLKLQNAIEYWNDWKDLIRESVNDEAIKSFFENTTSFTHNKRVFLAWFTLMILNGKKDLAKTFLKLLEGQLLDKPNVLMSKFVEVYKDGTWEMPNARRTGFLYELLCHTTDRLQTNPTGKIELGILYASQIRKDRGVHNLFLENPQNL